MKKLLFAITILFITMAMVFFPVSKTIAQATMTQTGTSGASKTTNTNTDTSYHRSDLAGQTNNFANLTIQAVVTKTSGTVAGSAILYASLDNSNWTAIGSDTLTLANQATNFHLWHVTSSLYRYYRITVLTSGTQVSSAVCKLLGRKVAN